MGHVRLVMPGCGCSQAREALQEAKDSSARIDAWAYSSLLKGYVRAGMLQEATELVQDMEASQILPNVVRCRALDGTARPARSDVRLILPPVAANTE